MNADAHYDEYDGNMIAMLELIWGEGFMTPGGAEYVRETIGSHDLRDKLVLDIGCGIGGHELVLAGEYGARVIGVDLEAPLIERARRLIAKKGLADRVEFRATEPGSLPFDDATFDVVYSSGAFTQIENKAGMFAEAFRVLKPGGSLLSYDWMKASGPFSDDMRYFFKMEGLTYAMETLERHGEILREAGFERIELIDSWDQYRRLARREYEQMKGPLNPRMIELLGREVADHFVEDWRSMVVVLEKGEKRPGRYRARKPA
ncbi:MAG: methyltransferase domain-containing protein [Dongiaceae bacterium]